MNTVLKNSFSYANKSIFLLSFSIALFPIVSTIATILFGICNILYGYFRKEEIVKKKFVAYIGIWGVFIIYLFSIIYSPNLSYGFKFLSRSFVLIFIPFVFWIRGGVDLPTYMNAIKYFIFGVAVSCILGLFLAGINYLETGNISEFTYYKLAETLKLHPTYFSLFILAALIFLQKQKRIRIYLRIIITLLFLITLLMLQSRIAIVGLAIVISYAYLVSDSKRNKGIILFCSIIMVFLGVTSKDLTKRMKEVFSFKPSLEVIGTFDENGINQRAWLWESAFKNIIEQPIFGYGLGSQRNVFKWQIEKRLLEQEFSHELIIAAKQLADKNFHNQYLQMWYECGLFGLLVFLIIVTYMLIKFYKRKSFSEFTILVIFLIFLVTENILARQMGIFFYAFVFALCISKEDLFDPIQELKNKITNKV